MIGNAISVATGTTSGLIDGGAGDLMYTGAATGNGTLAANSIASRSMWLQGEWSGFTGQIQFIVNGGGTNYRLGGTPGAASPNNGTNGSNFSQATVVLSGTGGDRGLSWNGAQGATVQVGTLSGTGGRIISGASSRDANWEVGGLNQNSSAAVVITGPATSLTKVGTGTLTLSGASTYGGTTTVSAGTLRIGNESALGTRQAARPVTQVVVAAGATLDFNGVPDATYGYTISGAGNGAGALVNTGAEIGTGRAQATNLRLAADATIGGTGNWALLGSGFAPTSLDLAGRTLTKAGSNTVWLRTTTITTGTITIAAGTLQALTDTTSAPSTAFNLANVAGASLSVNNGGTLTIGSLAGGGTTGGGVALANGSLNVGGLNTDTVYDGAITGGGRLVKAGTGTLTLNGASGYTGGTLIQAGMVKAGRATALGLENAAASTVTIASGATLDINRVVGNTGDFFYGITISGSGIAGQGALINTGADGGGFLRQTPNITLSANATIGGSGSILMINSGFGANALDLAGNTLTKSGTNTLFMLNTTVSAGTIAIQQGTLSHFNTAANASAAAITLADAAGATLALNNLGLQVGSLAGGGATGGNVTLGSATLTLGGRNENTSFGGGISGTGAVVKTGTGTQTFAAANTYSGGTTINGGTLVAGNANAFGTAGAISVGATGALGVGDGVTFTRPFSLTAGGRVRTGNNSTVSLPSVAALAAWESQSGSGDQTLAEILSATGSTTPTALLSAWTANPGSYFSDILTLEGTGAGNAYVLSMEYTGSSDNLNVWYRTNVGDPFTPLGTSFVGNVPWDNSFTTVGQYGVDTSAGTVWAVTDHNSQFVVVPEPGTLGLMAMAAVAGLWYRQRQRRPDSRP